MHTSVEGVRQSGAGADRARRGPIPRTQLCRIGCSGELQHWVIEGIILGEAPWPHITNQERFRCPACGRQAGLGFYGGDHAPNLGPFHQGQQHR